jgi:hypothetical protein
LKEEDRPKPKREITPAALYELFERHSQCVLDQSGRCPLLVFTQQMCWELNAFFNGEDGEEDTDCGVRRSKPRVVRKEPE